jgi:HAE1 family hydrophobic/amphiphilic exporter-1
MNGLSSWSIRNPIPTILLFLVLTLAGALGFVGLRTNNTPDLDLPTVSVTVLQPGAAPAELETQITRLVEDAVAGLGNVEHIRSVVNDGVSTTTIEFQLGTNTDRATNDVRNAVTGVRSNLPADIQEPLVQRLDATGAAILTFVAEAPAMSPEQLSRFVDNDVAKALLSVRGVARVERTGGVDREIRVRLDPDRLMALGITAADVTQQLRQANVNLPGGRATIGASEQSVRTLGSAQSLETLASTRIGLADGRALRLSDIGQVEDAWAEPRQRARLDGREIVAFGVYRTVGSSEVDVADAVRARLAALKASRPDVAMHEVTSTVKFVQESYHAAFEALWFGAVLAVLVVWWFLRDVRATVVSSLALPLSLVPAFAVMKALDVSLNNVTLLALSLVVGVLVDDAIVEIENIVRHMRESRKSAYEAAIEAADEIGLAVVATTFTIVAVFFPVGFMSGIVGQFFRSFAIASCVAVLFSLLVARTLTPLMGAYLMKPETRERRDEPRWMPGYLRLLGWALRHRVLTFFAGIALFAGSLYVAKLLPSDFVPAADRGRSVMSVELPPGSTLDDTDRVVGRVTELLRRRPEVAGVYAAVGSAQSMGFGMSLSGEVRKAIVTANLKPRNERALSQQQFERAVARDFAAIPGARIRFGADGRSGAKIAVTLVSDDPVPLARAVERLEREMRSVPGLVNPVSTASLARPELLISPKPDKAAELGVSATAIAQTVRIATLGDTDALLPKFNLADRQIPIRVMLMDSARDDLARLMTLQVHGAGITVPLASVAGIEFGAGPNQIDRLDRRRSATVEAELAGLTLGEASSRAHQLRALKDLPKGVAEVASGDMERMRELFTSFAVAIGTGILLVYAVLVLLFRGFLQPVTILTALPLSLGGALGLLYVTGSSLSISALIGILMLMGIAAKNSILLVEYAIVARETQGLARRTALMDAARKRARPIVMTTVAMGAGMLPIALGVGADAEFRAPVAIAVIGGLLSSTVLSLVYVPVVYTFMDGLQRRAGGWLARLSGAAKTRRDEAVATG